MVKENIDMVLLFNRINDHYLWEVEQGRKVIKKSPLQGGYRH